MEYSRCDQKYESVEEVNQQNYFSYLNLKKSGLPADLNVQGQERVVRRTRRVVYRHILEMPNIKNLGKGEKEKNSTVGEKSKDAGGKVSKRKNLRSNNKPQNNSNIPLSTISGKKSFKNSDQHHLIRAVNNFEKCTVNPLPNDCTLKLVPYDGSKLHPHQVEKIQSVVDPKKGRLLKRPIGPSVHQSVAENIQYLEDKKIPYKKRKLMNYFPSPSTIKLDIETERKRKEEGLQNGKVKEVDEGHSNETIPKMQNSIKNCDQVDHQSTDLSCIIHSSLESSNSDLQTDTIKLPTVPLSACSGENQNSMKILNSTINSLEQRSPVSYIEGEPRIEVQTSLKNNDEKDSNIAECSLKIVEDGDNVTDGTQMISDIPNRSCDDENPHAIVKLIPLEKSVEPSPRSTKVDIETDKKQKEEGIQNGKVKEVDEGHSNETILKILNLTKNCDEVDHQSTDLSCTIHSSLESSNSDLQTDFIKLPTVPLSACNTENQNSTDILNSTKHSLEQRSHVSNKQVEPLIQVQTSLKDNDKKNSDTTECSLEIVEEGNNVTDGTQMVSNIPKRSCDDGHQNAIVKLMPPEDSFEHSINGEYMLDVAEITLDYSGEQSDEWIKNDVLGTTSPIQDDVSAELLMNDNMLVRDIENNKDVKVVLEFVEQPPKEREAEECSVESGKSKDHAQKIVQLFPQDSCEEKQEKIEMDEKKYLLHTNDVKKESFDHEIQSSLECNKEKTSDLNVNSSELSDRKGQIAEEILKIMKYSLENKRNNKGFLDNGRDFLKMKKELTNVSKTDFLTTIFSTGNLLNNSFGNKKQPAKYQNKRKRIFMTTSIEMLRIIKEMRDISIDDDLLSQPIIEIDVQNDALPRVKREKSPEKFPSREIVEDISRFVQSEKTCDNKFSSPIFDPHNDALQKSLKKDETSQEIGERSQNSAISIFAQRVRTPVKEPSLPIFDVNRQSDAPPRSIQKEKSLEKFSNRATLKKSGRSIVRRSKLKEKSLEELPPRVISEEGHHNETIPILIRIEKSPDRMKEEKQESQTLDSGGRFGSVYNVSEFIQKVEEFQDESDSKVRDLEIKDIVNSEVEPSCIEVIHYKPSNQYMFDNGLRRYCNFCNVGYMNKIAMERHMESCRLKPCNVKMNPIGIFYCKICNFGITDEVYFKQHEEKCQNDYLCKRSNISNSTSVGKTSSKIKKNRSTRRYKCPHCKYASNNVGHMSMHKRIHDKIPLCVCEVCRKGFSRLDSLKIHMFRHIDVAQDVNELDKIKIRGGNIFKSTLEVTINNKKFTVLKYACSQCDYTTPIAESMNKHFDSMHLNITSFRCNLCNFTTKMKSNLKQHLNWHLRERTFKCSFCPYETLNKSYIKKHENQIHLKAISFKCSHCDFKTYRKENLKAHINNAHLKEKKFSCERCDYVSYVQSNLINHVKTVHEGIKRKKK
ncbi:uncharacterized protein LOC123318971 [Coccinella septempunctata]|uniref:uncharacterized protein LOC123318971 n=1 Tax=Coccinella septempunctata TaxID=41139 RepID=UPI001D065EE7|nr:uncharacterized protein LOC123318971 [Coccinella septempunctata]